MTAVGVGEEAAQASQSVLAARCGSASDKSRWTAPRPAAAAPACLQTVVLPGSLLFHLLFHLLLLLLLLLLVDVGSVASLAWCLLLLLLLL